MSFYLFPVTELNNKLEIAVVGNIMSSVPFSRERKSPVASLKFVPEIDRDLSSPDVIETQRILLSQLCWWECLCLIMMKKDPPVKGKWVPHRIGGSKWPLKMYADKHHLYGIALQQIIEFMSCAMDTMGELGEKQFLFPWKSFQGKRAKVVARSNPSKVWNHIALKDNSRYKPV